MRGDAPDPQPGELWATSKDRTVEILARDTVQDSEVWVQVDTVAYSFLGCKTVHLRSVSSIGDWTRTEFE